MTEAVQFKDSDRWDEYKLDELLIDMQPGFARRPSKDGKIEHLRTNNISSDGKLDLSVTKHVTAANQELKKYALKKGDVLFNNTNSDIWVGKTAFVDHDLNALFSNHLTRLRVDESKVDPRFLAICLHKLQREGLFKSTATRWVNQAAVNSAALRRLSLRIPQLNEQKRIATLLNLAEGLKETREKANQFTDKIIQSVFLKMFGDPYVNPMSWKVSELETLVDCLDNQRIPVKESERVPGETPYYGANGQVGWIEGSIFDEPLLLLAEDGGNWGKFQRSAYRIAGKSWVNNHAHVLKENGQTRLEFLETCLNISDLTGYISGTTRGKLTRRMMNKIRIPTPPLELQEEFASTTKKIESIQQRQTGSTKEISELFNSLMNSAFEGELGLSGN